MALELGELVAYLKTDNTRLKTGLAAGEAEMKAAGDRMGKSTAAAAFSAAQSWVTGFLTIGGASRTNRNRINADIDATKKKLRELAAEYDSTGKQSLLKDLSRERSQLKSLESAAAELATGGFATFRSALTNVGAGITNVGTNLWNLIPALLTVMAVIAALVPASYLLGGALGALPAIATGGLAAVATLGIGFMGLADAFKKTSAAGGAVVDRARQVALAERRVGDANREVLATQLALNRARRDAAERIQDLTRNLAGARLDEGDAIQAVADARRDLDRAEERGNPDQILQAQRAYARAQQTLEDVRDRVEDLAQEQEEASRAGVEGSDEVKAALERQRKAVEGVTDATYELRQAQKPPPGGGGAADEVTKLAASAAAAVATIKGLKPAFEGLRLDVQERLFAGVGGEIQSMSDAWMPTLRTRLGSMADMFNGLFKEWAKTSKDPEFIGNISKGWESIERLIGRVGESIAGPGLDAFGRLAGAAGPFLDAIGDGLGGIVEDFATWIKESEKSGKLDQFFQDAGKFLTYIIDIGKDAASIIGSVIGILMNPGGKDRDAGIKGFKEAMDGVAAWFNDPANREKIAGFFKKLEDFFFWVKDTAIPAVKDFISEVQKWADKFNGWADKAGAFKDRVVGVFKAVGDTATGLWTNYFQPVVAWIKGAWDGLWAQFQTGVGVWQRIVDSTVNLALWLIEQGFKPIAAAATWLWVEVLKPVWDKIAAGATWLWENALKPIWDKISGATSVLGGGFKDVFGRIGGYVSDAFTSALGFAKRGMNGLIRMLNEAIGFINTKVIDLANKVPGVNYPHLASIPELAQGGLVRATPGGQVARLAEAGQDEIVSPVDMMRRIVSEELARVRQDQPTVLGPEIHVYVGNEEIKDMVRVEVREHDRQIKRGVLAGAGAR